MRELAGRVAVVTGAASGLGLAMVRRFGSAGMKLVLADVEAGALDAAVQERRDAGHDAIGVRTDVTDAVAVQHLADTAYDTHGAVHVLCNNAGVVKRARTWELTLDDWNWVLDVDLGGVFHGIRAFVPRMLEQGEGGHVVNTSSMAGLLPIPNLGAYAAAKAAVVGLSLSLQTEFDQLGASLGVSVLCPGFIATGITQSARNRPATLAEEAVPPDIPRTTARAVPTLTADDVAEQVHAAVVENRFWILTHDAYRPVIREHAAGIGTTARPSPAPIW
jgi:NAD(P)-dependent dehydrogenase (short-subunit alcohol dehydrogenase family)